MSSVLVWHFSPLRLHALLAFPQPCTAYNYFFHEERKRLLDELPEPGDYKPKNGKHGKVSFSNMAKIISARWKKVTAEQMIYYAGLANTDKLRYRNEMADYKDLQRELKRQAQAETPVESHPQVLGHAQAATQALARAQALAQGQGSLLEPTYMHAYATIEPFTSPHYNTPSPSIEELATKLDRESINFLVAALK